MAVHGGGGRRKMEDGYRIETYVSVVREKYKDILTITCITKQTLHILKNTYEECHKCQNVESEDSSIV